MDNHRDINMGDSAVDWNDPMFGGTQFEDAMPADSPYGNSAFDNYTNLNDFAESPGGLVMRAAGKSSLDFNMNTPSQHNHNISSRSAESSSQDSASDTSSSRKRKTTSESPASDAPQDREKSRLSMNSDALGEIASDRKKIHARSNNHSRRTSRSTHHTQQQPPSHTLFTFDSTTSSPINPGAFDAALSLDEQVHGIMMPHSNSNNHSSNSSNNSARHFRHPSQIQTINPTSFNLRDDSPNANNIMFNNASPHSLFATPSSDTNETYSAAAAASQWNATMGQNPTWQSDYNPAAHFSSPGALHFTPSPVAAPHSNSNSSGRKSVSKAPPSRSKLHIAPIAAKSRVETQISIIMTLETPPPTVEFLHLPLQTIAKSKLLAKESVEPSKILELHTMLVCTSAMKSDLARSRALEKAASQNNDEIQRRAEQQRETGDEEKNDTKNLAEEDKPCNGGEVRICSNCIQRERKRAARKKLKKEEEQQHWERFETERVVVFNSNELLPFKPWEPAQVAPKEIPQAQDEGYIAPDGAMQVAAAMRIACYCRHQNEKEGFQVIFTLKDSDGNVVAQEMSDSILITDDHKTHPPNFNGQMQEQNTFGDHQHQFGNFAAPVLQTSYSMVDMSQVNPVPGFTSSRSTGNLQALAYPHFNQPSHVHHMHNPYASQTTSATMTPTSLSRPGSPTSAGNSGPNKKRKSSSFHRKVPSGLAMTPRVDTTIPPSTTAGTSAVSMMSQFSPTTPASAQLYNQDQFMNVGAMNGQFIQSGPSTPSENLQYASQQLAQSQRPNQPAPDAYRSLPGSRVSSRPPSPVMQSNRPGLAYARQQMSQGNIRNQMYPQSASSEEPPPIPMIHKITPTEGPVAGGTEVSIYGRDFLQGMQVYFGDQPATAITFYGEQALLCTSPPGRVGGVQVTVLPVGHVPQYNPSQANRPIFTYKNANEKVMEMALRLVAQQQTGNSNSWWQFTQQNASRWSQAQNRNVGFNNGYDGNALAMQPNMLETSIKSLLKSYDQHEIKDPARLDIRMAGGTPLTLAVAAGLQDVAKGLLVRGAHPDTQDQHGFTALMYAGMHSRVDLFQLLVSKGADPAIRSLAGYSALDVAPIELRATLQQKLWTIPRSRHRPSLKPKTSQASLSSSVASWSISSASMYESEDWNSSASQEAQSRRPSIVNPLPQILQLDEEPADKDEVSTVKQIYAPLPAAMLAWQNTIIMQIQQFHTSMQKNIAQVHFALRPLNLDEYEDHHDNAMLRRVASLLQTLNETFPFLPTAPLEAVLPPAYSDLYPEKMHVASDGIDHTTPHMKMRSKTREKRSMCPLEKQQTTLTIRVKGEKRDERRRRDVRMALQLVFWLCVPSLVILLAVISHAFSAFSMSSGEAKTEALACRSAQLGEQSLVQPCLSMMAD